jgi:hypothetical protein
MTVSTHLWTHCQPVCSFTFPFKHQWISHISFGCTPRQSPISLALSNTKRLTEKWKIFAINLSSGTAWQVFIFQGSMPSAASQGASRVVQMVCLAAAQLQVPPLPFLVNYRLHLSDSTNRLMRHLAECDARTVCSFDTTYIHTNVRTYIHAYIHTNVRSAYIHTYIHTNVRTYVHTYIHTYVHSTDPQVCHKYNSMCSTSSTIRAVYSTTNILHNSITDRLYT